MFMMHACMRACVCVVHLYCSAQLNRFNMEKSHRKKKKSSSEVNQGLTERVTVMFVSLLELDAGRELFITVFGENA